MSNYDNQEIIRQNLDIALRVKGVTTKDFAHSIRVAPRTLYGFTQGRNVGKMAIAFLCSGLNVTEEIMNTPHDEIFWRQHFSDKHQPITQAEMLRDINSALANASEAHIKLLWSVAQWVAENTTERKNKKPLSS